MNTSDLLRTIGQVGYASFLTAISQGETVALRDSCFRENEAGRRCLLDEPLVQRTALALKADLLRTGVLGPAAVAVQAIAFDKTDDINWKVAWHQDLMFPFARRVRSPGYTLACIKDGVDFARPPLPLLQELLAARLHLDPCGDANGPLRVAPGTHRLGIIPGADIPARVAESGEAICFALAGEALLMRPLLLHASSRAKEPNHRRVLHLVYHRGSAVEEPWHRAIG